MADRPADPQALDATMVVPLNRARYAVLGVWGIALVCASLVLRWSVERATSPLGLLLLLIAITVSVKAWRRD